MSGVSRSTLICTSICSEVKAIFTSAYGGRGQCELEMDLDSSAKFSLSYTCLCLGEYLPSKRIDAKIFSVRMFTIM